MADSKGIQSVVIKVASRCNLNCSYCYVYNMGDYTYMRQPKFMSDETVSNLIKKVKSYVTRHDIKEFQFIFHGGEPLLTGKEFYKKFIAECNDQLSSSIAVIYSMQTNGVLLDDEWAALLTELNVFVGISFDGTKEMHDKFRLFHHGGGSFDEVVKGIGILKKYRPVSLLSVVNCESDPLQVYDTIRNIGAISYDLLLPDATHDSVGALINTDMHNDDAPYGDWLIKLYEYWKADQSDTHITIQFFESIIKILMGGVSGNALIGNNENNLLVIQTDGSYESPLKVGIDGFTRSGISVHTNEIDEACSTELVDLYYNSHFKLCEQCANCPISDICGGGLISHRYAQKNGFNNPSVYCKDLMKIITHIQNDFIKSLPEEILQEENLEILSYERARQILKDAAYA